ncbi:hypothetical protein ACTL6U_10305 [Rhodovibrionaceae bacterium A322]
MAMKAGLLTAGVLALLLPAACKPQGNDPDTFYHPPTKITSEPCYDQAERLLAEKGIDKDKIASVEREQLYTTIRVGNIPRGTALWVRLKGLEGQLVFEFAETCRLRTAYTTGGLQIVGFPSY